MKGPTLPRRMAAAAVTALVLQASGPAAAQTCLEAVQRFAAAHNLSPSLPPAVPPQALAGPLQDRPHQDGTITESGVPDAERRAEQMNRSGGVLTPPPVGDRATLEPPATAGSSMPTAPPLSPDAGSSEALSAARQAQMDSLLTAARQAAASGDENRCLESLAQAARLADAPPSAAEGNEQP